MNFHLYTMFFALLLPTSETTTTPPFSSGFALTGHSMSPAIRSDGRPSDEMKALWDKFQTGLSESKFVGRFTVAGQEDQLPKSEEYTISQVKKLDEGDWWEITARIRYGDHDLTLPMRMEVKWAGTTPVITVDRLFIPTLGTFDARVLLRGDQYAGTWAHDDVGGHLFGKIVKLQPEQRAKDPENQNIVPDKKSESSSNSRN